MIRTSICAAAILALVACAKTETDSALPKPAVPAVSTTASTSPAAEQTYPMTATIVSRDPGKNTVNLDNKEVPGRMMAMKMDYELRGAKVDSLPPDGTPVEVTMHDADGSFYITDVKPKK